MNASGVSYVWYAFAHDPSTDGIIQCGSFTTDSSGNATVNLGWEPQFLKFKRADSTGGWHIADVFRGWNVSAEAGWLFANTSAAENNGFYGANRVSPSATGFTTAGLSASATYIYLAIRRPNKPPTSGTQVYNAIARTGTGAAATVTGVGFAPDLMLSASRSVSLAKSWYDRLRGPRQSIDSTATSSEATAGIDVVTFGMDGYALAGAGEVNSVGGGNYIHHVFKRAPGVFDVVAYAGTGSAMTVNHSLGVTPELIIFKQRNPNSAWTLAWTTWCNQLYSGSLSTFMGLNSNLSAQGGSNLFTSTPSSSSFTLSANANFPQGNEAGVNAVAYLFATKAGISKVGSYTGNGSSQTINCGFSAGARFCLIKRTDSTGDWYVWDTARGIVSANDPHLSLNTTAAEVTTDDSIDPDSTGFIVNQVTGTDINVSGRVYIYLAFA